MASKKKNKLSGALILPALMANTLERERFAAMMANILFRLKAAEDQLDLLLRQTLLVSADQAQ